MFPCPAMLCQCCHRIIIHKEKYSVYKYFMSKLKSFIRWKENEGATGMTTDRPFIHDPVRNIGATDKPCGEGVRMLTQNCC